MARTAGRSHGPVRQALMQALLAGASGTWDALARHAGVDPAQARRALVRMRSTGEVVSQPLAGGLGRPRAIYAPPDPPGLDSLSYARQVWR